MKLNLLIFSILLSSVVYSQSAKDSLLQEDINVLVEEMEFMYGYDQTMREYTIFKTFDKSETDRIENLPDTLRIEEMKSRKFESDSIGQLIWQKYINPMDAEHTERMIEITKKYGFPSTKRIKKYYNKEFVDPEFNPYILLVHAPKKYWEELKVLMENELEDGTINKCTYGHLLWHVNGRNNLKYLLENGYQMVKDEDGTTRLKAVDCN